MNTDRVHRFDWLIAVAAAAVAAGTTWIVWL